MDSLFSWLFSTRQGVLALVIGCAVIAFIVSIVLERGTGKQYYNHEPEEDDESGWSLFDDDNK